jgi:sugar diacid utilization regulator
MPMSEETPLVFEGGLSAALRALLIRERAHIDLLTQHVVQMLLVDVPDYGLSNDPRMMDDLRQSAQLNAELWFEALLDSKPLSARTLEPVVAFARRRVHQGISLTGLLRAYRTLTRGFWLRLVEAAGDDVPLKAELTARISPYLLRHFDHVAEAISTLYLREQSQHARWRDRLRQELWSIIRSRPDDAAGFREHAEALGFAIGQAHCAAAIRLSSEAREQPERVIDPPLLALARKLATPVDALMRAIHRDHLVVWAPKPPGQLAIAFEKDLAEAAGAVAIGSKSVVAVGIGLPGLSARGWQASMEQALRALSAPADGAVQGRVHRYSQIMIEDAIRSATNVADFVHSTIEGLSAEPALLETLQAYLDAGLHRKETAATLSVHPNTLDHRLARIETLLDGRFSDIGWVERVHAALRLHRAP